MSRKISLAETIALAATFCFALLSTQGSVAAVQARNPQHAVTAQGAPAVGLNLSPEFNGNADATVGQPDGAASLSELVSRRVTSQPLSAELNCLAGAIYFESKSEPLAGQLAVGRVIVARAQSGRFPSSYCGVVYQPSQFSFVRGKAMPTINKDSNGWKNAVAIAQIANDGSWSSPVEGALYFHAARVSPRWRMARVAKVGNHIFYR